MDNLTALIKRAAYLADQPIDALRSSYPVDTPTQSEAIRFCKERGFSRGDLIQAILTEEFDND